MTIEYKAKLKKVKDNEVCVNVERTLEHVFSPYLEAMFVALLRNMKDTDEKAFYLAMAAFAEEDFDDAAEWIEEQMHD